MRRDRDTVIGRGKHRTGSQFAAELPRAARANLGENRRRRRDRLARQRAHRSTNATAGRSRRARPICSLLPRTTAQVSAMLAALVAPRRRLRAARRGHRAFRRMPAARGAGDDLHLAHEPHRRDRPGQPARRGPKRRGQSPRDQRGQSGTAISMRPILPRRAACTIGGNIAENSGGPHTLKYGVTTNHVLGVELVLAGRRSRRAGRAGRGALRLRPGRRGGRRRGHRGNRDARDAAAYARARGASHDARDFRRRRTRDRARFRAIIAAGIIPGAIEMMDALIIRAVEAAFQVGFPADAGAVLIVELDGLEAGLGERAERIARIATRGRRGRGEARARRGRARAAMESAQARVRRGRAACAQLRHPGRRGAAHAAARHPARDHDAQPPLRARDRQCLPRRRRQYPSDRALRRTRSPTRCGARSKPAARFSRPASRWAAA